MRRKLLLMSQVLGQPQEQEQLPLAIAQAPSGHEVKQGHGEGSDFWLTSWSTACESPLSRAFRTTHGNHSQNTWSNITSKEALLQHLHCMEALLQDLHCTEALLQYLHCMEALSARPAKIPLQCHSSSQELVYVCKIIYVHCPTSGPARSVQLT